MVRMMRGGRSGGFSGRGGRSYDEGPPDEIVEVGEVMHSCEGNQVICKATIEKVPYFNKYAYLENKAQLGKVDEILGPTFSLMFSIQLDSGVKAESLKPGTKVYMGSQFLFPISRFTEQQSTRGGGRGRGGPRGRGGRGGRDFRGGGRGFSRGGRGDFRGQRGGRGFRGGRG